MEILIDGRNQILYQWDRGQRLLLHGADAGTRVDFARCNDNKAVSKYAYSEDGAVFCDIPDALLMEPDSIHGYAYESDGDRGETIREFVLPVIRRPKPEDYVEPEEVLLWHTLKEQIEELKASSGSTVEQENAAELSVTGFARANGTFSTAASGLRTDFIPMDGVTRIFGNAGLYNGCSTVAFYGDANETSFLPDISVRGTDFISSDALYGEGAFELDVSGEEYAVAKYFVVSTYRGTAYTENTQTFADDFCKYVKLVEGAQEEAPRYRIAGSKIAFFGDSITAGAGDGDYPSLIATITGATVTNHGVSGATLATGTSASHHIAELVESYTGGDDIICISGGYNDYGLAVPLGKLTEGYTVEVDTGTVIGALESIFRNLLTNHTTAKLYYVITHKANDSENLQQSNGLTFRDYHDAIVSVLRKYSIPFYDAFSDSEFITSPQPAWGASMRNLYTVNADGIHPNAEGYRKYYVYQIIAMLEDGMSGAGNGPESGGTVEIVEVKSLAYKLPATVEEAEDSTPGHRKYILGIPDGRPGNGISHYSVQKDPIKGETTVTLFLDNGQECTFTIPHGTSDESGDVGSMTPPTVDAAPDDNSLGITGAVAGQTIVIKEADENGKPTTWEAVDSPMTDNAQITMLIEADMLPAIHNPDGKILTDETGRIVLRY